MIVLDDFPGRAALESVERVVERAGESADDRDDALDPPMALARLRLRGEATDLGADSATPVSDDYGAKQSAFTGRVRWVQIDLGEDATDADHLITPEERLRLAIARQ